MSDLSVTSCLKDRVSPGLADLLKTTKRWGTSMAASVSGVTKSFFSLRSAVVGVAAVCGARLFGNFVTSTAEAVAELSALADSMGVSVQTLSEMQYALGSVGLKAADTSDLFRTMGRAIAQATQGSAAQVDAFKELGISVHALSQGNVDLVEFLGDVSEGLSKMGSQADKTQALIAIFGKRANG